MNKINFEQFLESFRTLATEQQFAKHLTYGFTATQKIIRETPGLREYVSETYGVGKSYVSQLCEYGDVALFLIDMVTPIEVKK